MDHSFFLITFQQIVLGNTVLAFQGHHKSHVQFQGKKTGQAVLRLD